MKLNDPFGRMANRHQLGYETMRDAMQKGGITTIGAAKEIIETSKKRAIQYLATGGGVLLLVSLLFPSAVPITLTLGLLMVVFVTNSTLNGKRYIERYIEEDLQKNNKDKSDD